MGDSWAALRDDPVAPPPNSVPRSEGAIDLNIAGSARLKYRGHCRRQCGTAKGHRGSPAAFLVQCPSRLCDGGIVLQFRTEVFSTALFIESQIRSLEACPGHIICRSSATRGTHGPLGSHGPYLDRYPWFRCLAARRPSRSRLGHCTRKAIAQQSTRHPQHLEPTMWYQSQSRVGHCQRHSGEPRSHFEVPPRQTHSDMASAQKGFAF